MVHSRDTGLQRAVISAGIVIIVVVFTSFFFVQPASARVLTVNGTGGAGSLQDLINSTNSGDSIYLAGGTYYGNLRISRPIVFGALDSANPPIIISSGASDGGIVLAADGITLNGVIIEGTARYGLLVMSNNNRISTITVQDHDTGIGLKSATGNIFSGNTITHNSNGIEVDRSSHANIFYLNTFDNSREIITQSADTIWYSGRQSYRYAGKDFSGAVGNFWNEYNGTDGDGDGIGDTPYTIQDPVSGSQNSGEITDRAPLVSPPYSYTLAGNAAGPFNASPLDGGLQPPEFPTPGPIGSAGPSSIPSASGSGNPFGPQNPLVPFIAQYWWTIPLGLLLSLVAGIWFERKWKRGDRALQENGTGVMSPRNATVVKKTPYPEGSEGQAQFHYAARLPPALERKYPAAEYLAEGGVSRVFRAWDEKERREVAIKIPIRFDEVAGAQFTKELHVWEGLHHNNIVEIYAANIFPVPFIEMEYVETPLSSLPFPLETARALSIVRGVAEGLRYAHEQGIVHRDIKPGNIMIAPDGTPKISDWGLSKAEGTKQSGLIGFSLEYAAPEQLAPNIYGEPGPWTDIYQIGVLFYEMMAGHVPFRGGGMGEITHAILHDEPLPLTPSGQDAALIRAVIARCMAKNPGDRYRSVSDLIEDLKNIRS